MAENGPFLLFVRFVMVATYVAIEKALGVCCCAQKIDAENRGAESRLMPALVESGLAYIFGVEAMNLIQHFSRNT